jgi:hypothetical protein
MLTYQRNVDKSNYTTELYPWMRVTQMLFWHKPQSFPRVPVITYKADQISPSIFSGFNFYGQLKESLKIARNIEASPSIHHECQLHLT